jgi:hypothetical protein
MMNTRSRASAVEAWGLKAHPALALVNKYRDRIYVKTVYHADPFTLSMKLQLRLKGEAAPGAPAGVPAAADLDGALAAAAPPTPPAALQPHRLTLQPQLPMWVQLCIFRMMLTLLKASTLAC